MEPKEKKFKKYQNQLFFLLLFTLLFSIVLWWCFHKESYQITYQVDDYQVTEIFDGTYYSFWFEKDTFKVGTVLKDTDFFSKKIVNKIETISENKEQCIQIQSDKIRFYPLCTIDQEQIAWQLTSDVMQEHFNQEQFDKVEDIAFNSQIFNYAYAKYFIWNYRGFNYISENKKEEINLFKKDIYDPSLIVQIGEFLVIPDYSQDYFFDKLYLLDMQTLKYEIWDLKEPIYFESSILGVFENEFYLLDKHEHKEWKMNPQKQKMDLVGSEYKDGVVYQNGWKYVSMTKLLHSDYIFTGIIPITYQIINQALYAKLDKHFIKMTDNNPLQIVAQYHDKVFYLKEDILYVTSFIYGTLPIMQSFEWNFNSNHIIYVYS